MINTISSNNSTNSNNSPSIESPTPISTPPSDPTQKQPKQIQKKFSKARKKKLSPKYILAGIMLLLLTIGGGIGLYLTQINQDLRQQADTGSYITGDGECTQCLDGHCVAWDPTGPFPGHDSCTGDTNPTPTETTGGGGGSCSGSSAAQCQGENPGDSCGGAEGTDGTCKALPNQTGADGKVKCGCDRGSNDPTPTPEPPICAAEAGTCLPKESLQAVDLQCATYTDSCEKEEKCANPLQECVTIPLSEQCEPCNETLALDVPNSRCIEGLVCNTDIEEPGQTFIGGSGVCIESNQTPDICLVAEGCSETSDTTCQGKNPGDSCESGQCTLEEGTTNCSCVDNPIDPTATPEPTAEPTDQPNDDNSTTVVVNNQTQPEIPKELPQSGPEDWLQYLQVGLGALGVGAILLLFL